MRSPIDEAERRALFSSRESIDPDGHFIVHYRLQAQDGLNLEEAAARVLLITSLRTMRHLPYESLEGRLAHAGRILSAQDTGQVEIALPLDLCTDQESLAQLLLIMASGAEYSYTDEFWIETVEIPKSFAQRFRGPRFGVRRLRELFNIPRRAIVGLIVKPRAGAPLSAVVKACREALMGGVDFIADDLLMVDPPGDMSFRSRVPALAALTQEMTDKTHERKLYFANIASSPRRTAEYMDFALTLGVGGLMVNAFTMGFGAVHEIVDAVDGAVPIIATNMGVGILTRPHQVGRAGNPTGISDEVVSKLSRLAGVDAVHAGTSASECFGDDAWGPATRALWVGFHHLESCFPVAEGDLTIGNIWENISSLGPDVMLEPTSGILSFPGGPGKGAEAFRLLASSLRHSMSDAEAQQEIMHLAGAHRWLRAGLDQFGYTPRAAT